MGSLTCPECEVELSPGLFELSGKQGPQDPIFNGRGYLWSCFECGQHYCGHCLEPIQPTVPEAPPRPEGEVDGKRIETISDENGNVLETREIGFINRRAYCSSCERYLGEPFNRDSDKMRKRLFQSQGILHIGTGATMIAVFALVIGSRNFDLGPETTAGLLLGIFAAASFTVYIITIFLRAAFARKINNHIQAEILPSGTIELRAIFDLDHSQLLFLDEPQDVQHKFSYQMRV